jgi:hypothetical protein
MLIKGDIVAADLRESWLATVPDNGDPKDTHPYDR